MVSSSKLGQSQGSPHLFSFFQGSLAVLPVVQSLKNVFSSLVQFWLRGEGKSNPCYLITVESVSRVLVILNLKIPAGSVGLSGILCHCLANLE